MTVLNVDVILLTFVVIVNFQCSFLERCTTLVDLVFVFLAQFFELSFET